jgi:hypothetical protein
MNGCVSGRFFCGVETSLKGFYTFMLSFSSPKQTSIEAIMSTQHVNRVTMFKTLNEDDRTAVFEAYRHVAKNNKKVLLPIQLC